MTKCVPFSVICFLSQSGMNSDGYCGGYVSFAHFCYIFISEPILKLFVALFRTHELQKDGMVIFLAHLSRQAHKVSL